MILLSNHHFSPSNGHMSNSSVVVGDVDLQAIWAILVVGWLATIPLVGWSSTVRALQMRPLILIWAHLIGATIVSAIMIVWNGFTVDRAGAVATCSSELMKQGQDPLTHFLASRTAWDDYNCTIQCGSLNDPSTLRRGSQMVPYFQQEFRNSGFDLHSQSKVSIPAFARLIVVILSIRCSCVWWIGRRSTGEARDDACSLIAGSPKSKYQRLRHLLAVSIGIYIYFSATLPLLCPMLVIYSIIFNEMDLSHRPQEEPMTAVGQWSPIASSTLILMAVVFNRYRAQWGSAIKGYWRQKRAPCELQQATRLQSVSLRTAGLPPPPGSHNQSRECSYSKTRKLLIESFTRAVRCIGDELHDFFTWLRDPINISTSRSAEKHRVSPPMHSVTSFLGSCSCEGNSTLVRSRGRQLKTPKFSEGRLQNRSRSI